MPGDFEQSRFDFLEDQYPGLSYYVHKAEQYISSDPNICLLYLGRTAEIITEFLCRRNNICMPEISSPPKNYSIPEKLKALAENGIISENISRKISALTEFKNYAANEGNDSESACRRLMFSAEELCRWYILSQSEGRFAFLADLFPPDKPVPVLMNFAQLGREAEENLHSNTRYCLICLGDIGEAAADRLLSGNGIETHEKDQVARIDVLADKYIITDETRSLLHELRIARNKALHERYNSEYTSGPEAKRLIEGAYSLCRWLFRLIMKPGYIVKARITGESEQGYSALIGKIPAHVPAGESYGSEKLTAGKKYAFKVSDTDSDTVMLGMIMPGRDYDSQPGRLYAKYKPGQDVHATIKSLSNSTGAIVELKDGLEARIPPSELGRKIYRYDDSHAKMVKYDTVARVKWFSLTQYPPLLLSVKDVEEGHIHSESVIENTSNEPEKKRAMSDMDFRLLCKSAPYEKVIQALDEGANPNASNGNNTTALMMAAQYNRNSRVIKALTDAGAEIDAQNHKGNSALMYAAMSNNPDVVMAVYEAGADISLVNSEGKRAADFAVSNRKLNGTDIVSLLKGEKDDTEPENSSAENIQPQEDLPVKPDSSQPDSSPENEQANETQSAEPEDDMTYYEYEIHDPDETRETPEDIEAARIMREELQRDFLRICRSGSEDEIAGAVSAGVEVNVANRSSATALMFAAQSNTAQAVEILIHAGAFLDAQDDSGNTALIYAASYNNDDVVDTLIDAGADKRITNRAGHRASDYAAKNYRLDGTEALNRL